PHSVLRHSAAGRPPVMIALSRQAPSATSLVAASRASAAVSPAVSTNSQPPPRGRAGTAALPRRRPAARGAGHGAAAAGVPHRAEKRRVEALRAPRQVRKQGWPRFGGGRHVGV